MALLTKSNSNSLNPQLALYIYLCCLLTCLSKYLRSYISWRSTNCEHWLCHDHGQSEISQLQIDTSIAVSLDLSIEKEKKQVTLMTDNALSCTQLVLRPPVSRPTVYICLTRRFSGLMSLCAMLLLWMYSRAWLMSLIIRAAHGSLNRPLWAMASNRSPPVTNSISR